MMLAKVCSDKNKPNGQYRIPAERQTVMDFIQDLPIRKVGLSTAGWLQDSGAGIRPEALHISQDLD